MAVAGGIENRLNVFLGLECFFATFALFETSLLFPPSRFLLLLLRPGVRLKVIFSLEPPEPLTDESTAGEARELFPRPGNAASKTLSMRQRMPVFYSFAFLGRRGA